MARGEGVEGANFLHKQYKDLHTSREVGSALRAHRRDGSKRLTTQPGGKIDIYLTRLESFFTNPDEEKRDRGVEIIKGMMHREYVIKPEDVPESYFALQQRIAKEQGHGDIEISNEVKKEQIETIIYDQTQSLDQWIDYLSSNDAMYPNWLKYYVIRNVVKLGPYDKEKKEFRKRSQGTTALFPDIDPEALAYVCDALEKSNIQRVKVDDPQLQNMLDRSNFAALYAHSIENVTPASLEEKRITSGEWVMYNQGSDPAPLCSSLQGRGTGWCTVGRSAAKAQLERGDFYVFYSRGLDGENIVPRIAVRMEYDEIAEVRGIDPGQNLELSLVEVAEEKINTLPGADEYRKKVADMKAMTMLEKKQTEGQPLTRDELVFLYEINAPIEGFGFEGFYHKKDPRIEELRRKRNLTEDLPVVFGCTARQIAHSPSEINKDTKVYVGKLEPGIFKNFPAQIEHIYTSFPEEIIHRKSLRIGDKTKKELQEALQTNRNTLNSNAEEMMRNIALRGSEVIDLVQVKVRSLGFTDNTTTTDQLYERAKNFGLELCPAETVLQLRLADTSQPMGNTYHIAVTDNPDSFILEHTAGEGMSVSGFSSHPHIKVKWRLDNEFVFRIPKPAQHGGLIARLLKWPTSKS